MKDVEWKSQNPITLFGQWLLEAETHESIREPTAMALATYSRKKGVSNRIVLLKGFSETGFVFYTNYQSHKGVDLEENPRASALFYWDPLAKQVRITGPVKPTSREESDRYWRTRPRESQLSQYISKQSQAAESRESLESLVHEADAKFKNREIPCPSHWGGFVLQPDEFEFWQSRPGRLHDRFTFAKMNGLWTCERLYP